MSHDRKNLTPKAKAFISRKVRINIREGYRPRQAIAIAFSQARKQGFKIPEFRRRK